MTRDVVEVWEIDLDDPRWPGGRMWEALPAAERARVARHDPRERRRRAVGRGAARMVLAAEEGTTPARLRVRRSPFGKPELEGARGPGALRFSLSRSGGTALLALARGRRVGVNLEALRALADPLALAGRMLTAAETEALGALPPAARHVAVLRGWTRSEAYLKARGDGLHRAAGLALRPEGARPARVVAADGVPPEGDWRVADLAVAGHLGAVAAEGGGWEVRHRRLDPPGPDVATGVRPESGSTNRATRAILPATE